MKRFTKLDVFYLIASYFMLFAFVGVIFNVVQMAIAWSISIFIILWCAYWFIRYCIDMYYYIDAMFELMKEEIKEKMKLIDKRGKK
jgi:hypothetical protein